MAAYYNEFDPFAASWLKELIKDGLIADGVVDERSIAEVSPDDLKEFTQCHFFAGIGGWSIALRLAEWPDDRAVWTGSPPCQPFSVAGNQKGNDDERHLWPVFFDLIKERTPPTVFGEQVASAIRHGWFDSLQTDMENQDYATAMVVLPACSVGSPQKRDRMWYVADKLANTNAHRRLESLQSLPRETSERVGSNRVNSSRDMGDSDNARLQMHGGSGELHIRQSNGPREDRQRPDSGFFDSRFIYCRDGKARPIPTEPALFPLADGIPNRVGILRGAGNAIVPQVAAEVIRAYMDY